LLESLQHRESEEDGRHEAADATPVVSQAVGRRSSVERVVRASNSCSTEIQHATAVRSAPLACGRWPARSEVAVRGITLKDEHKFPTRELFLPRAVWRVHVLGDTFFLNRSRPPVFAAELKNAAHRSVPRLLRPGSQHASAVTPAFGHHSWLDAAADEDLGSFKQRSHRAGARPRRSTP